MTTKYTDLNSDSGRLPEGFTRTGYDADTSTYTYTAADGTLYSGLPGNRYGRLYPSDSSEHRRALLSDSDTTAGLSPLLQQQQHHNRHRKRDSGFFERQNADWGYLAPFLLIVMVALFLVLRWSFRDVADVVCRDGEERYVVLAGDTCWSIAERFGTVVEELRGGVGSGPLDCARLAVGRGICVGVGS